MDRPAWQIRPCCAALPAHKWASACYKCCRRLAKKGMNGKGPRLTSNLPGTLAHVSHTHTSAPSTAPSNNTTLQPPRKNDLRAFSAPPETPLHPQRPIIMPWSWSDLALVRSGSDAPPAPVQKAAPRGRRRCTAQRGRPPPGGSAAGPAAPAPCRARHGSLQGGSGGAGAGARLQCKDCAHDAKRGSTSGCYVDGQGRAGSKERVAGSAASNGQAHSTHSMRRLRGARPPVTTSYSSTPKE